MSPLAPRFPPLWHKLSCIFRIYIYLCSHNCGEICLLATTLKNAKKLISFLVYLHVARTLEIFYFLYDGIVLLNGTLRHAVPIASPFPEGRDLGMG